MLTPTREEDSRNSRVGDSKFSNSRLRQSDPSTHGSSPPVRCLRKLSRGAFVVRRRTASRAAFLLGADDPRTGTREAREDDAFSARARGSEPSRSRRRLRRARFLGPRPRARHRPKHGETEIKVARVDASSFATGVCEAAARMSANGATTGEGDVRTLWIGDLVRFRRRVSPFRRPRTRPRAAHRSRPTARETAIATSTRRYFSKPSTRRVDALRFLTRASLDARARAHHDRLERRRAPSRLAAKPRPRSPPFPPSEPTTGLLGRGAVLAVVFRAFRCVRVVFAETHRL